MLKKIYLELVSIRKELQAIHGEMNVDVSRVSSELAKRMMRVDRQGADDATESEV